MRGRFERSCPSISLCKDVIAEDCMFRIATRVTCALICVLLCSVPAAAQQQDATSAQVRSLILARSGATHFRGKRFLAAARAFEEAYRLNPVDPRNLRYSGRAWQEVGALERALSLLERYALLESKAKFRASIQPRIEELQKLSARQRAEALASATRRYPQGKLEVDAARSLVRLGSRSDMQRALKLYETARIWASDSTTRSLVAAAIDKIRTDLAKPEAPPAKAPTPAAVTPIARPVPAVVATKPDSSSSSIGWYIAGGVVAAAGVGSWLAGYVTLNSANQDLKDNSLPSGSEYDAYTSKYDRGLGLYIAGIVGTGVGAAAVVVGLIRSLRGSKPSSITLAPQLFTGASGLSLHGQF
ncbi:MAG TPA: hypothetical protein DCQ06_00635 [Myxococcales bacterium]|nr:hypothetical protein [Myxococcales bacterium]HAN30078.1 hypothetical protein [Myxococcales bacterium]